MADLLRALTEHHHYKYRGCAPDELTPARAAGDLHLSVDAWSPTTADGGEEQRARLTRERAAKAVCARCPVLDTCGAYGLSTVEHDGTARLVEPEGILGGMLALDRHRHLIQQRITNPAPASPAAVTPTGLAAACTAQKQAVLRALASTSDALLVAERAGMDVRTANWQRSALCGLLGVDRETATRQELLDTAQALGVLPAGVRVIPDRIPVAAAPDTTGARQRRINHLAATDRIAATPPTVAPSTPSPAPGRTAIPASGRGGRLPAPPRTKFTDIHGQLSLDDIPTGRTLRLIPSLSTTARLETAA
ncbi:WhiB family transcriptional regulator [Streptomyces sp. NPDC090052]|uniref:WhiB family transcriptional regulator n=1 Tax=Streptomyces sp. NPDC090052 TaxID=3365931 RepID=UPI0037FDF7B9